MLKKFWNWLLGKTTIDEKIISTVKTVEARIERVKEETSDLVQAVKEVRKQAVDVVEAVQGSPRKGRKSSTAKKTTAPQVKVSK